MKSAVLIVVLISQITTSVPAFADVPKKKEGDGGYYGFVKKQDANIEQKSDTTRDTANRDSSSTQSLPGNAPAGTELLPSTIESAAPLRSSLDEPQGQATPSHNQPKPKLFLWKATKGSKTVYLTGTIHVLNSKFYPLPQDLDRALADSNALAVELTNPQLDQAELAKLLKEKITYPAGDRLSKHLSPETKKAFDEYLTWAGESVDMYDEYKPWFLGGMIQSSALRREGYKSSLGLDEYYMKKARELGKKIIGLETPAFQLQQISSDPESLQDKQFRLTLLDLRNLRTNIQALEEAWKKGEAAVIEEITVSSCNDDPDLLSVRERIIDRRNQSMAARLDDILKENDRCFVAVGAAHLVGEQGLPMLLEKNGFVVEQLAVVPQLPTVKGPTASKLKKLSFPEGRFSVMLPGTPEMSYKDMNGMRFVDYNYPEFLGTQLVSYGILPGNIVQQKIPSFLDLLAGTMAKANTAKVTSQYSLTLYGKYPGRQVELSNVKGKSDLFGRLKIFVVGNRFYVIGGVGKKAWLASESVNQFMNSLAVSEDRPRTTAARRIPTSLSKSSQFREDFDRRQTEFNQRFRESQSRARKDFEQSRAKHEAQWGRN